MPKQPVTLSANICGCGDPLSIHTKTITGTTIRTACDAKDCACTGFIPEAEAVGDAPHSISTDTMIRAAGLNPKDPRVLRPAAPVSSLGTSKSETDEATGDVQSTGKSATRRARGPDPEKERVKEERYGPLRKVTSVTSETKAGKRVVFECGHAGAVAKFAQRGRCRVCKKGDEAKPKRTPVAAEPEKPKRTPVVESSEPEKKPAKKTPVTQVTPARRRPAAKKNNAKRKR